MRTLAERAGSRHAAGSWAAGKNASNDTLTYGRQSRSVNLGNLRGQHHDRRKLACYHGDSCRPWPCSHPLPRTGHLAMQLSRSRQARELVARSPDQVRRLGGLLLNLVYPGSCVCCQSATEADQGVELCDTCRTALFARAWPVRCGSVLAPGIAGSPCPRCRELRLKFTRAICLGTYDGLLRTAVLRMKRPADRPLAVVLGGHLAANVAAELPSAEIDVVMPVPMHWSRRIWREPTAPRCLPP